MRSPLVPFLGFVAVAAACSSTPDEPPPPPAWVDAPASIDLYAGRSIAIPIDVRTDDAAKLTVTAFAEGVEAEIVGGEATGGSWRGTLLVRAGYGLDAPVVGVDLVDARAQKVTITPAIRTHELSWRKRVTWDAGGPQTREHGAFFVDAEAKAVFMLQGSGYSPQFKPIDDSWRLDLSTGAWTPWTPTGDAPPGGGSRRVAPIPGTKKAYAYGGYTGFEATSKSEGDLYRVDLGDAEKTFTRLTSAGAGPPRQLHAIAYDAKGDQLVVFGGFTDVPTDDALDDTWLVKVEGDTATWRKVEGKAPSPRYGSFTAFDTESRRFVVWSGAQFPVDAADPVNAAQDAWALDLEADPPAWTKLAPTGEAPPGRRNGCAMHDPIGRRLFVFGGTSNGRTTEPGLFVLALEPGREAWTKLSLAGEPPLRSSGFTFATPEGDVACAFGNGAKPYADVSFLGYAD
ncbi:MAG: hypothetical protein KF819_08140 [Labilithrix sp.]|nr:hypothetical protein [Labilithrix sp.]